MSWISISARLISRNCCNCKSCSRLHCASTTHLPLSASLAGVTALPTDPAVLLQLGPVANSLASALPTSSVLSVLLTAAPSGFVSSIVNDPSFASSFESAFSAGNSPAWFTSLPTSVRSYLHTYSGFGGLAGAGAAIKSVNDDAANGTAAVTGSGTSSTSSATQNSAESAASVSSASAAYVAAAAGTASGATNGNTASAQTATASGAKGGAARPSGAGVAGWVGVAGLLGVAAAL